MPRDDSARVEFPAGGAVASGLWTPAAQPVAAGALAHGAGAGMAHPFMAGAAAGMAEGGVSILRFNFLYMDAGRRPPDRPPVLLETWQAAIEELARRAGGPPDGGPPADSAAGHHDINAGPRDSRAARRPMVMGGKSMGGRMASMLAAAHGAEFPGAALVFFGYPLHPAGQPERLRDEHLPRIRVPMLFIQGTRDALARMDLVEGVVRRLRPLARLHVVPDGDHSFHVRGAKRPDREIGRELGEVAARYVREILRSRQ